MGPLAAVATVLLSLSTPLENDLPAPAFELWRKAGFGRERRERAAWVVVAENGALVWRDWPPSGSFDREVWRGPVPDGTIAIVHTHANGFDPRPSLQDEKTARLRNLPVYAISRWGVFRVTPEGTTEQIAGEEWWSRARRNATPARDAPAAVLAERGAPGPPDSIP